jgi:hypothetical protein
VIHPEEEVISMSMVMDLIWRDDGFIEYRAGCDECPYQSGPLDDEETARASWFGHVCVRAVSHVSA